jgi:hypothetical protein
MTDSFRDICKNFRNKLTESEEESVAHNEFVSRLPQYNTEIQEAFEDVFASAKRIKCSTTQSQRVKDMLMDDLRKLQRKVRAFISIATEEERSEEYPKDSGKKGKKEDDDAPEEQQVYDDPEDVVEISSMAGGNVAGGPATFLKKKYGKKSVSRKKVREFLEDI